MKLKLIFVTIVCVLMAYSHTYAQITVTDKKGDLVIRFFGRTNFDAGTYINNPSSKIGHNGVSMNDTRFGFSGSFDEKWSTKVELYFGNKNVAFRDLYIGYKINDKNSITVGNQYLPFGAKPLGLQYKFIEDPASDYTVCPSRKIGFNYVFTTDPFNVSIGLYSDGSADNKENIDQGFSIAGKMIYRPVINESQIVHFGLASIYTQSPNSMSFFDILPESVFSEKVISTPNIKPDNSFRHEGEIILILGKFYTECHYLGTLVELRDSTDSKRYLKGAYAQMGWMIIGEKQNYNPRTGLATSASPGSLEILYRINSLNLEDLNSERQIDHTIGLNYFINRNLNIKINYIYAKAHNMDDQHHFIQSRLQFSF